MELTSADLEFRGLIQRITKDGKIVYNANFENLNTSEPFQLYVGEDISKFSNIEKGDIVSLFLRYNFNYKVFKILDVAALS